MANNKQPSFNKPPLPLNQQVDLLESRGILFTDKTEAENILLNINYYRFGVYAYHRQKKNKYKATNFDDIIKLYYIDKQLRELFFEAISTIEIAVRSQFAYHLSINTSKSHPHLDKNNFNDFKVWKYSIYKCKKSLKPNHYITKLKNKYADKLPPIWANVELMTFGELSKWYSNLNHTSTKQTIANNFNTTPKNFETWLKHLTLIRNTCAHHEFIWSMSNPNPFSFSGVKVKFTASHRIYDSIFLINYILNGVANDKSEWYKKVIELIKKNKTILEPTKYMGVPKELFSP